MTEASNSIILESVEYLPNGKFLEYRRKLKQRYCGVHARASDGLTCLSIQSVSAYKRHNIEVGRVYAITLNGRRHVFETPHNRWRLRSQEILQIVEGRCEEWAQEYFDSNSQRYFKNDINCAAEVDLGLEARFAFLPQSREERRREKLNREGGDIINGLLTLIVIAGIAYWFDWI